MRTLRTPDEHPQHIQVVVEHLAGGAVPEIDDAFGQRIISTMFTSLNQYHVVMEVDPKFQYGPIVVHAPPWLRVS